MRNHRLSLPPSRWFGILVVAVLLLLCSLTRAEVEFQVEENLPIGTFVGRIPTRPGFTYRFNENLEHFVLNGSTGEIRTRALIDREALSSDVFDLVVLSSQPTYPVEVRIVVKDVNDCAPRFPEPSLSVSFPESASAGTRVFLDTAEDADAPENRVHSGYKIVSGNEDSHFRLVVTTSPSGEPFLHLETTGRLDRETRPSYNLNISAEDEGLPQRTGYLTVNVSINDVNDSPPVFAQSQYYVSLNESVEVGSAVLQVQATDEDEGENARVSYHLGESEEQFSIESETGTIRTAVTGLNCPKTCGGQVGCPKTCVLTVFARDHGTPRQDGRAYVTITLLESNHAPDIKFRYFPPTANTASILETAPNASVVAAISVVDLDEGENGQTEVEIVSGNELKHFILESTASFQLVRTNGALDREKIPIYNLTITAKDKGNPPCSSTSFLIIQVTNDKDPEISFPRTEYSAVLRESAPVGSYVASIAATEETARQVIYSIVSGNERQWFEINPGTGLLTTKAPLDREQQGTVRLKIAARDGGPYPKWAHAQIKITIMDENDEVPKFEREVTELSVPEDVPPGSQIALLSATDHDQGINGTIIYTLSPQTELLYPNQFQIDPAIGKVITKAKLDREENAEYELIVVAKDQGSPALSSTAIIHLKVKDVNDNSPVFYPYEYFLTVGKDAPPGTRVGQVFASDADSGGNGKVSYNLRSTILTPFVLDEKTGILSLKDSLRGKSQTAYQLQVVAQDGGGRSSENEASVNVRVVSGGNSAALKFSRDAYSFTVEEDFGQNAEGNREIGRVELDGKHSSSGVTFSIINGDPFGLFLIEVTGVLKTAKLINREEKGTHILTLLATKGELFTTCKVSIAVSDLNDEVPTWDLFPLEVHVRKDAPIGDEIAVVKATDKDFGMNAKLTYSLLSNPKNLFAIDPNTGLLTLLSSIRLEKGPELSLELEVRDGGEPSLSARRSLIIHLSEVNLHSPVFDQTSYETSLQEGIAVNTKFFTLEATDKDLGRNGELSYSILSGNEAERFGIFPDGALFVKGHLDRETADYYSLIVRASDHGTPARSAFTTFVINVLDENDIRPKFRNSTFTFSLPENGGAGEYVGRVIASDGDVGRNAELTYHFTSDTTDFAIDHKTGFIKALKPFDREVENSLQLEVMVHDNGVKRLSDKALVIVKISDVNDNPPGFPKIKYEIQLSEDAPIGSPVLRLTASDPDEGLNGDVLYSIVGESESELFHIEEATGLITLSAGLDRETKETHLFTVVAQDMSESSPLRSEAFVVVTVTDTNDCPPVFQEMAIRLEQERKERREGVISLSEMTPVATELAQFLATDSDLGQNGQISYSITGGNRHETFQIHGKSGILFLNKELDYEKQTKYSLTITAKDAGSPALSASTELTVQVLDHNDCAPQFLSTSIVRQIQEGISLKTPIVTVTAEDADSGDNGKIRYSIKSQFPPGSHFGIDPASGTIHTLLPIDREFADTFRLTVVAQDQAAPANLRLSSEKLVTVIIEDVNDCEPIFTCLTAALLKGNSPAGIEIMKVAATDLDSESNGLVTFDLVSGDNSLFRLNRLTGSLTLKRSLPSVQPRYQLRIRATDEAIQSQRKSADLDLIILGLPESMNTNSKLRFEKEEYAGSVSENEPAGTSILTVSASAGNGESVEYYLTNITSLQGPVQNRLFDIDTKRGVLSTSILLDREMGLWNFQVEIYAVIVSAGGLSTAKSQVKVDLLDVNDSPPQWPKDSSQGLTLSVSENAPVGQEIATLKATDADTTGSISYSIVSGDEGKFALDSGSGSLKIISTLDREEKEEWIMSVRASDGSQYSDTLVTVLVSDTNDNPPAWDQSAYSLDVPEDAAPGHVIGTLEATDRDAGVNGKVTYSILSDWGDDVFSLHPNTGVVTLTGRLDYESVQHYIFVVQAQDTGLPSLSSTTTVYLNVLDLNDNPPVFDTLNTIVDIPENMPVGSSVIMVSASDADSGENGKVRYRISHGNADNAFSISGNGTITTLKVLDRETVPTYVLTVIAEDGAKEMSLSATIQITINLKDVNDCVPSFISPDSVTVVENTPINSVLLVVKAVDKDEGRNGYVEYTLHNERSTFSLGGVDGLLRVVGEIDRENASNYTLKITAKDRGDPFQSATQELFIKVRDKNDHGPKFDSHQYSASVPENSSIGTNVLQVTAFDMDEGLNSQIRYSIIAGDPNRDFSIGDDSGLLRVARALNYERKRAYTLTIQVEDLGEESRYDTATVSITILDINDRSPIFLDSPYIAYIRENLEPLPQSLLRVHAHDADSQNSKNLQVRYLLKEGDKEAFRVNSSTGEITVHRMLDREKQGEYYLSIVAMDTGTPRLTGTGTVQVIVSDQNDCDPTFDHESYELSIPENSPRGTLLTRVYARDEDAGENAIVKYKLLSPSPIPFEINEDTGEILSKGELDRETEEQYKFSVVATDSSTILPRSSTAEVTVTLLDENDHFPKFKQSSYSVKIPETISSGNYVSGFTATDADSGLNGEVRYFLGGPDADKFQLNETTGILKAIPALVKSGKKAFAVEIRAVDSSVKEPLSSSVSVKIAMVPPERFPKIRTAKQEFTFLENISNTVVTNFEASPGENRFLRKFQYFIGGGNVGHAFEVDRRTGQLRISSAGLDYETATHYELWIEVCDEEEPEYKSAIPIYVKVRDVNDNTPAFELKHYNVSISEEEFGPKLVTKVVAIDKDSGANGALRYYLSSESVKRYGKVFEMRAETGEIYTKVKLDREEQSVHILKVEAVDLGEPPRTGTATVTVNVEDINDNPMKFTRLFSVNVTENAPLGTFVIQVTSADKDVGQNANCSYSFPASDKFKIDPLSGNVTVSGPLDREKQDEYLLKVSAVDGSWKAETLLTISIEDVNDVAPSFEEETYSFNVPESDHSVSFVGQVHAVDKDKRGPNSAVSYYLKHQSDLFTVDPVSGEIFTKKALKYKHRSKRFSPENEHSLVITAVDSGKPPLSSEVEILVNVVDADNHPPVFPMKRIFSPVLQEMPVGTKVLRLQALDEEDYGMNAELEYLKIGGNGSQVFDIDKSTGWVILAEPVVSHLSSSFLLHVRAMDKGIPPLYDDANLILSITGQNNFDPVFSSPNYRVIVPENEAVGTTIVTLSASDKDSGPNGQVRYNISRGNEQRKFAINAMTGAVSINGDLDYDTKKEYVLKITATDLGFKPRSAEAELIVILTDVNDNPPYFEKKVYRAKIKENAPIRTPLFTLSAKDRDSPKNGVVRYAIVGGSGKHLFTVDPITGQIVSTQVFDYEERAEYGLDIMATNPDSNLHGTCKVEVEILGENEYIPKFVQSVFHFSVSESAPVGHFVGSVQATDQDSGEDGEVFYILVGSSNDRGFLMNPVTGGITVSRRLDRESQSRVVLSALAKNQGSIRGNDTDEAQIVISVQDGNDPPVFEKDHYEAEVAENAPVGTQVLKVVATDIDVRPTNNRFVYKILSEGMNSTFKIDPISGVIYTAGLLDRETVASYRMVIGAVDTGVPPGIGKTTVSISLGDINDNAPTLKNSSRLGEVLENEPSGTKIMTLEAIDLDSSSNGEPFTFTVLKGMDSSKVRLDPKTGTLFSTTSFDREQTPELSFLVEIVDGGSPSQRRSEKVTIKIADKNDSPSKPRNAELIIFMKQAVPRGQKIATVQPIDPDLVGKYSCRLESNNDVFSIPKSCDLHVQKLPSNRRQSLSIIGDDGLHPEVVSNIEANFFFLDDSAAENSIIVRAVGLAPKDFLAKSYSRFNSWLKSTLHTSTPHVYNVMPFANGSNLILAVPSEQGKNKYAEVSELNRILSTRKNEIEGLLGVPVIINFSPCTVKSLCQNGGLCSHTLRLSTEQSVVDSDLLILSTPKAELDLVCKCLPEFTGESCQHPREPCSPNPCQEGGSCLKNGFDFSCSCPPHRQGKRCEIERSSVCGTNPCLNGGTCQENHQSDSFFCLCRPGFFGDLCQTASNLCKPNPCMNGGECINQVGALSGLPKCRCKAHFFGRYCEKSAYGFGAGSYMAFSPLDPNTNDISITFSTNKRNSLLAYGFGEQTGGRSDFVAVQIINGRPTLSYGGARTEISTISVNKFVADSQWYRIIATRNSRVVSLYVSTCQQGGENCEDCKPGNNSCYASGSGKSGTLNFNSLPLLIGGVNDVESVLERPGQIQADDFVGCIHSVAVNGRHLNLSTPLEARSISEECQRVVDVCEHSEQKCGMGQCLDLWDTYACNCNGVMASNCQEAFVPYTFTTGSFLEFKIGEKFKRNQILPRSRLTRTVREISSKHLSITFRTIQTDVVVVYASSEQDYTLVEIDQGEIQFTSRLGSNEPIRMKKTGHFVSDGAWHTLRLTTQNKGVRTEIDGNLVGEELDASSTHDFLDPYLSTLILGGTSDNTITNKIFTGFTGCMVNFTINNENQAFNTSSGLFDEVMVHGKLTRGCSSAIAGAATAPDPLSIGVTLVIVFFVFLLVAIMASFVIFRMRRKEKSPLPNSKLVTKPAPTGQSPGDVVRSHLMDEDSSEALRNFVRNSKKLTNNTVYQKPDIIERTTTVSTPPQLVSNLSSMNSSLLSPSHGISMDPELPDMPEHYDLENASSIAPSDIDIVYHYKGFRDNFSGGRSKSSPFRHNHQYPLGLRQSPISNVLKSTPLARLSPSSELSQQITPRILTLQDISGKPLQSAFLSTTQKESMSQSEQSLNISHSSRSSMVSPGAGGGGKKRRKKYQGDESGMNIGLTAEEIERLNNSRHKNNSSLVSTLDDLSSESEHPHPARRKNNLSQRPPQPDSSSGEDESGNDSFPCSDFDYDNTTEKGGRGGYPRQGSFNGSLSTLVAFDNDLAYITSFSKAQNQAPGGTRWDYLLNWGPNFDNLSGVFKDIAQLPDPSGSEMPSTSSINTTSQHQHQQQHQQHQGSQSRRPNEEYV